MASSEHFRWTDETKLLLVRETYSAKAYKKTKDTMETKWKIVLNKLASSPMFTKLPMNKSSHLTLQNAFLRLQKEVLVLLASFNLKFSSSYNLIL